MNKFQRIIAVLALVTVFAVPALAQDDPTLPTAPTQEFVTNTPTAEPIVEVPTLPAPNDEPLETAADRIVTLINDISFLPWSAALVLLLTQLTKRFITQIRPVALALVYQVVIWIVYAVANHYGFGQNVQDYVGAITKIVEAILTVAPALVASAAATEVVFRGLRRQDVPGFKQAA